MRPRPNDHESAAIEKRRGMVRAFKGDIFVKAMQQ
jgi:hypothetical protein